MKRLRTWEQANVPVYSKTGEILAFVKKITTSVGASKAAKAKSAEWSFRFKTPGWVVKDQ